MPTSLPEPPHPSNLAMLDDDCLLAVIESLSDPRQRPCLRLVCRRLRDLVDGALTPCLAIRAGADAAYGGSPDAYKQAAAAMLRRCTPCLRALRLDFEAYGCVFAAALLEQQALPLLAEVSLLSAEAHHVSLLRGLPRLRAVSLARRGGPAGGSPAAESLVAQLAGLPGLRRLALDGYRCLPGLLGSVADALPGLAELSLGVAKVEAGARLDLAALPRLPSLAALELRLLGGRAAAPEATVAALPPGATGLAALTRLDLAHVRPARGEEGAFWAGLALLPTLRRLGFTESGHAARQPPPALLRLGGLTRLAVRIDGEIYSEDPPASTWTQLPELPEAALPRLASLHLDCVGLLALPASWCRLPLTELHISGLASERSFYSLRLPEELPRLAGSLARLELPRCGLGALPAQVAALTGLTALDLRCNDICRLPPLSQLQRLADLELFGSPATNAASALQGCAALRRLGLGSRQYARSRRATADGGAADPAYPDAEAAAWQGAYLQTVRAALPWVDEVAASYPAVCGLADGSC